MQLSKWTLSLALLVMSIGATRSYADTISTWNGGTGNWSTAGNWTPAAVPNNSGSSAYAVTINSGSTDVVSLDISPTVDSLTLGGTTGLSTLQGDPFPHPVLTVLNGMTINPTGILNLGSLSSSDTIASLSVGGTLTNAGAVTAVDGPISVGGNLSNSGSMNLFSMGGSTFAVNGTLTNQSSGRVTLGFGAGGHGPPGPTTTLGQLVNNGSLTIGVDTTVTLMNQPNGITDIPAGSSLELQGALNAGPNDALRNLTTIEGQLILDSALNSSGINKTISPSGTGTLMLTNSGSLDLNDKVRVAVFGNISNSGSIGLGGDIRSFGSNLLTVSGTLTNNVGGQISLGSVYTPNDQINVGSILSNAGSIVIRPGSANGQAGVNVGIGAPSAGYNQLSDGTLDELILGASSYGTISDSGPASLSGTLDIVLQNGFFPTPGESFAMLTFTPGELTGTWDTLLGDPYFKVTYDNRDGDVTLTAEAAPEPATVLSFASAFVTLAVWRCRSCVHYVSTVWRKSM